MMNVNLKMAARIWTSMLVYYALPLGSFVAAKQCPGTRCKCYDEVSKIPENCQPWDYVSASDATRASTKIVDCSRLDLTEVPKGLSNETTVLLLGENKITNISTADLINMTKLECLDLFKNPLTSIPDEPFRRMHSLNTLLLENTKIEYEQLTKVVCNLATQMSLNLDISNISLKSLTSDFMTCLERLNLTRLDVSNNQIGPQDSGAFSNLLQLEYLLIGFTNQIPFNPLIVSNLSQLKELDIRGNFLRTIPDFTNGATRDPILPNLEWLFLNQNLLEHLDVDRFDGLQNLVGLEMNDNIIYSLEGNQFQKLPKLKRVAIRGNRRMKYIDSAALNHQTLEQFDMLGCQFELLEKHITLFGKSPNLQILLLGDNDLSTVTGSEHPALEDMFQNATNLRRLGLFDCSLQRIPEQTFRNQAKLQRLYLYSNHLRNISLKSFQGLVALKKLDISANDISNIDEASFPPGFLDRLETFNFEANKFSCDCDLRWLRQWMNTTNVTIIGLKDRKQYTCFLPPELKGKPLEDYNPTLKDCTVKRSNFIVVLSASISSAAAFIIILLILSYKYRWHINYVRFLVQARRRQYRQLRSERAFLFDAFVSYNRAELSWVKNELLTRLEEEEGLSLCIHDRDWVLGADVMDNMVESIENSRKIILVVSNAFAQSQWCQLEMTVAQHRLLDDDRNALLLIVYETVSAQNMTPRLALEMRRKTYIEWTDHVIGRKLFWKKLAKAIKKPSYSIRDDPDV